LGHLPFPPREWARAFGRRRGPAVLIGVISDTHGFLDPQIAERFRGVEAILHAGDIGTPAVLEQLGRIAPVFAVRGNVDRDPALLALPERLNPILGGVQVHLVHQLSQAAPLSETRVLVFGHSHRALSEWRGNILYLNPGAAGRQGFHTTRTIALLRLDQRPESESIVLGPKAKRSGPDERE
jgi:putative phosphoesterase